MIMPRIYLDTNHWIELFDIIKGQKNNDSVKKLYKNLIKLRDGNRIKIPFSAYNYFELLKYKNIQRRNEIIDFMIDTSNGWYFRQIDFYFKYEILNVCFRKIKNNSYYNLYDKLLTNRIDHLFPNISHTIVPKDESTSSPEEIENATKIFEESDKNTEHMKVMFKDEFPILFAKTIDHDIEKLSTTIERDRINHYDEVSDTTYDKYTKQKWFVKLVVPTLSEFLLEHKINPKLFLSDKKEMNDMLSKMPSLDAFVELSYTRDKSSKERPVKKNDYYDICHFATALPYCDVIIGEKMFGNISQRTKLDRKNYCLIFSSLSEFAGKNLVELIRTILNSKGKKLKRLYLVPT